MIESRRWQLRESSSMSIINSVGNIIPHSGRRFILDQLGLGKLFARAAAEKVDAIRLPNGLTLSFNPILHGGEPAHDEPEVIDVVRRQLGDASVFYDVGANIGYYSLMAATIIGAKGQILAFEPNETNLRYLRQSLAQPFIPTVSLYPLALGVNDGTMTFDGCGTMSGRLVDDAKTAVNPFIVNVRSIDSLVEKGHPIPTLIKIDVEGGEGDVLEGAAETLRRHRPVVICEMHTWAADGVRRAEAALTSAGYKIEQISEMRDTIYRILATHPV
jgi:FkbM family methyltransferase